MTDESDNENGNAYLINRFNDLAGTKIWVAYFSNNWFHGISDAAPYTQKNIVAGKFDTKLREYARSAKSFGTKLLIE